MKYTVIEITKVRSKERLFELINLFNNSNAVFSYENRRRIAKREDGRMMGRGYGNEQVPTKQARHRRTQKQGFTLVVATGNRE